MSDQNNTITLTLVARSEMAEVGKSVRDLRSVDQASASTTEALKKTEAQAKRTADAIRSVPRVDPNSTLASAPRARDFISPEQLRREEREAGLRTERTLAAEDREAQTQKNRRERFFEDTQRQRSRSLESDSSNDGPGLFDTIKNIKASTAALLGAIAGAATLAAKALREYSKEQQSAASVEASLATRGANMEVFREKVHSISQTLQDTTGVARNVWEKGFAQAIENGADVNKLDEFGRVLANVAGLMRGDVTRASLALSNALEGNFTSLHHVGIIVPENASQLEKWAAVVRQSERGAGQLAAQNETLAGQFALVKNSANDLFGVVGKGIATVTGLSMWLNIAGGAMAALAKHLGGVKAPAVEMNNALTTSSQRLAQVQDSAAKAAREFNSIHAASERASQAMERQARAAEAIHRAQDNIASARLDLNLAQIDAAEHGGRMSPQQAAVARANARLGFEQGRFQRDQLANTDQIHAAEARLNQLGTQRGLAESEKAAAQAEFNRQTEAHSARAEAANAAQEVEKIRRRIADSDVNFAGAGDQLSPSEIARNAIENRKARGELGAAEARAAEAQRHAESFGPGLNDTNLASATERLAKAADQLEKSIVEQRQNAPGLQDAVGNARLNLNANAAVFEMVRQAMAVHLNDQLSNSHVIAPNIAALRAQLPGHEQENLIGQLRQALQLRNDLMVSGFTDLISGINADIRNIQSQLRTIANRR